MAFCKVESLLSFLDPFFFFLPSSKGNYDKGCSENFFCHLCQFITHDSSCCKICKVHFLQVFPIMLLFSKFAIFNLIFLVNHTENSQLPFQWIEVIVSAIQKPFLFDSKCIWFCGQWTKIPFSFRVNVNWVYNPLTFTNW